MKKRVTAFFLMTLCVMGFCGCSGSKDEKVSVTLNPNNPVSLTIWHYYNGTQQATFDALVDEFNATVGKEQGIYVEGYSQGSVEDLQKGINSALNEEVGAEGLPDIFSSYADTAYAVQQQGRLADLTQYFSKEEISAYVDAYIQEGYFQEGEALYLLPVAKSTEVMMINQTDWEPFSAETGCTLEDLSTVEGVVAVAEKYYQWTDAQTPQILDNGKAFYGRDSMANYFVIGMRQMGEEIFSVKDGAVTFRIDKEKIRRLWDNYYIPYIKGYFAAYGKFRSDDVKTGEIIAYTGSTSSAFYFPDRVENGADSYPISYVAQRPPIMEGGTEYMVQQGAGMAVTKSDAEREYAACVFLKWFTQKEQNLQFVCESSYMPVLKEANNLQMIDKAMQESKGTTNEKAYDCIKTVLEDFDSVQFYTTKNFKNGYMARNVLEHFLSDKAETDKKAINDAVSAGAKKEEVLKVYTSDENFDAWYQAFEEALLQAVEN